MHNNEKYLSALAKLEKMFDAMYRRVAVGFALPDCAMWILYFLASSKQVISQQELIEMMMFPKQTINSSIRSLSEKGLVTLEMIPGTTNKKKILLTGKGREKANETVARLRNAEARAVEKLGFEKVEAFMAQYENLYSSMEEEFRAEGLISGEEE